MNSMKEISVIVPVYNVEKYLEKCLDSLENQKFNSYEVILVDDGSTDNSRRIAERYADSCGEIFMLVSQENKGLSEARNTGMKYANGKYICFVDSDDYVEECYLEELYRCMEEQNADLVFCAFRSVDEIGNTIRNIVEADFDSGTTYTLKQRKDLLLTQNAAWNKLYKKDIIVDNNLQFTPGAWYEDLRFVKKYMLFASRFAYCDHVLYNYLIRQGSIMNSMGSKRNVEIIGAIDEVVQFYKKQEIMEEFYDEIEFLAIEHIYVSTLVRLIRSGDKEQFRFIKNAFEERFPHYKKNKYIDNFDKNKKIIMLMMNMRLYGLIRLLFNIKEKKHA